MCAGDWPPPNNFEESYRKFYNTCVSPGGTKISNGQKIVARSDGAVSFMCSYASNPCNLTEWVDAVRWTRNTCAGRNGNEWMEAGWLSVGGWKKASRMDLASISSLVLTIRRVMDM